MFEGEVRAISNFLYHAKTETYRNWRAQVATTWPWFKSWLQGRSDVGEIGAEEEASVGNGTGVVTDVQFIGRLWAGLRRTQLLRGYPVFLDFIDAYQQRHQFATVQADYLREGTHPSIAWNTLKRCRASKPK